MEICIVDVMFNLSRGIRRRARVCFFFLFLFSVSLNPLGWEFKLLWEFSIFQQFCGIREMHDFSIL